MRLLYIADNGFSFHGDSYYYTRPNDVNSSQYRRYFSKVSYIARKSSYKGNEIKIDDNSKVRLVGRYDIIGLRKAMKELKNDYDVVLVRNGLLGCFAAGYAKQMGKTLISYCGADPYEFQMSSGTLQGYIIAKLWKYLEKKKMKLADYAHYCTLELYNRYPCKGPYLVCSNVNVELDHSVLSKRIDKINNSKGGITLGLIGPYMGNDNKGISIVIRSMSLLDGKYRFEVVGDGSPERYVDLISQNGLEKRIRFLGYISDREKLMEWLDKIDIYLQPSLSEGLPRATIEAMSRGCPVIGSDVCGMKDLLPNQWMVNPKDYRALASVIRKMTHAETMKDAAERNYRLASNYCSEIRDEKMDDFYGMIINKGQNE